MPPEIQSETDRIFLSFWVIFCLFTHPKNPENQNFQKMKKAPGYFTRFTPTYVYSKWQSYDVWFLRHENFEKIKTMPQYIIILHMCTTNDNHMMFIPEI